MNKRISVGVAAAIAMIAVTITFAATLIFSMRLFDDKVASYKERAVMYDKISEIDALVRENYYSTIVDSNIEDSTISGYVAGLNDPYSAYLTAEEYASELIRQSGQALSFGIQVEQNSQGYMEIRSVVPGSAAETAGLLAGDLIFSVDATAATNTNYDEVLELMNVSEGTTLSFIINRDGQDIPASLTYERLAVIAVNQYLMGNDVGYIRILNFTDSAPSQFQTALSSLRAAGVEGLVIDLRSCRTGYYSLDNLTDILNMIIPSSGSMISGRYSDGSTKLLATSNGSGEDIPIVVMVNEETEYFGELFAAVMRDLRGAPIVGEATKGHGTYQTMIALSDGSAIAVSTATFLTSVSGSYDGTGIMPDYVVPRDLSLLTDYSEPSETEDAQYSRARTVLRSLM